MLCTVLLLTTHVHHVVHCKISYFVAIVDCTHIRSVTAIAQENTTADILLKISDSPLDMVAVDNERELYKPNS